MTAAAKQYVIRYDGAAKSYFTGWVQGATAKLTSGRVTGLPAFGGTLKDAARYDTSDEAQAQIDAMPIQAGIMCDVRKVKARSPR